jgi:hypothetical protein
MKTNGDTLPNEIEVDKIKNGSARLNCAWNIAEREIEDEDGNLRTTYDYESGVIWWALPKPEYITDGSLSEAGEVYLQEHSDEILGFIQATKV